VITPSYNQGKFLEETIRSIVSQDYPNFEYIIIDGGSNDNSVDIIRKYESALAYWVSERDTGFGNAINKGFARATGDIICWVNSDDLLLEGALLKVGKFFLKNRNAGLVYGDRHVINKDSKLLYKKRHIFYFPNQLKYMTIPQECAFWRRDVFYQCGGLDETLKFAIDFDLWCKLSRVTKFRHIPFFLGVFRYQPDSKTSKLRKTGKEERRRILLNYFRREPSPGEVKIFRNLLILTKRFYRVLGFHKLKIMYLQKVYDL
jgi:glycosyltransferase involved in cell wall biosynthesis